MATVAGLVSPCEGKNTYRSMNYLLFFADLSAKTYTGSMSNKPKPKRPRAQNAVAWTGSTPDYESLGVEWRAIGLSSPARRALVDAKLYRVSDLRKISLTELAAMHGMGKSAIARLKVIMEAKRIRFLDQF